jgi:hypothetical protein
MTEEFWADYKKKKDLNDTNILWKNVNYTPLNNYLNAYR